MSTIVSYDIRNTSKLPDFVSVLFDVLEFWETQKEHLGTFFSPARCFSGLLSSLRVALDMKKGNVIGRKGRPTKGGEGSRDAVRSSRPFEKGRKRRAGSRESKDGCSRHRRSFRVPRLLFTVNIFGCSANQRLQLRTIQCVTWNIECAFMSCISLSPILSHISFINSNKAAHGESFIVNTYYKVSLIETH